jgi:hypothetical protein
VPGLSRVALVNLWRDLGLTAMPHRLPDMPKVQSTCMKRLPALHSFQVTQEVPECPKALSYILRAASGGTGRRNGRGVIFHLKGNSPYMPYSYSGGSRWGPPVRTLGPPVGVGPLGCPFEPREGNPPYHCTQSIPVLTIPLVWRLCQPIPSITISPTCSEHSVEQLHRVSPTARFQW